MLFKSTVSKLQPASTHAPVLSQEDCLRRAEQCIRRGRLQRAIRWYRALLAHDPTDLASLNRIGDLLVRTAQLEPAIAIFLRVAAHYAKDGFLTKAIAIYRKILRLDPLQAEARRLLTGLYRQRNLPIPLFCAD